VERQAGETWGRAVVQNLAKDLQAEFPGISGFSTPNLYRMRQFYEAYHESTVFSPLVREISWTRNLAIPERCRDVAEREYYLRRIKQFGWSKNVLIHQIENQTCQKTILNKTNFTEAVPEAIRDAAKLAVKDEYTFDFLELADEHTERRGQDRSCGQSTWDTPETVASLGSWATRVRQRGPGVCWSEAVIFGRGLPAGVTIFD
jgi:hypothetical protein